MCPVRRLVWQWAFIVLLADQHRKRPCLAGASTCFSVGAPNQFVSFDTLCSMFDVLAVCAPNQFVSFDTLCSMFDVLAVCAPNQFVSFGTLCSMFDVLAVCAPNQFVSFGTLCSMFDVLAVCAPNQFVSFGTLCFMFDVLAVRAPNQFVSFGTLCSMFDVLAVCAPNQFVSFGTLCSVFHVRCVSCWCAKPVRVIRHTLYSMFDVLAVCVPKLLVPVGTLMFHNGHMTYCVFDLFTEPLQEESSTGGSGKNQLIRRLETGLHFFLGNTECLTTCLLRNDITSAVSVSWCPRSRYCQSTGIQCWSGCLDWFWIACWIDFSDICDPNWRLNVPTNFRPPLWILPASSSFQFNTYFLFTTQDPGTRRSAERRSRWDARLSSVNVVFVPVPRKIGHPSVVVLFIFCRWIAGGCDGFPSRLFETDDDTDKTMTVC